MIDAATPLAASVGPVPPCAGAPVPGYPAPGPLPTVRVWQARDLPRDWRPPACLGWRSRSAAVLVAAAGRFRDPAGIPGILRRLGAVSRQTGIAYWSVTRGRWRPLLAASSALRTPDPETRRADFQPEELHVGARVHFLQDDNDPLTALVQELTVHARSDDRLEIAVRNLSAGRLMGVTVIAPGEVEALFSIEREEGDLWRYYALSRSASRLPVLLHPPEAAYVNRAVALFRFIAGLPTDAEPPAARE